MKPLIRNYGSDWYSTKDRKSPPPRHDTTRLELLAPLIKQAVELALKLKTDINAPLPVFWTTDLINDLLSGDHPADKTRAWCFSHLYEMVTERTNAIVRLVEESYVNAPFVLLRSAMESLGTCHYISEQLTCRETICHNYIAYSLLRAVYDIKSRDAKLRRKHKMRPHFPEDQFVPLKGILKDQFRAFPHHLAWIDPSSETVKKNTAALIESADKKYAKLYHLGNLEVHGNYAGTKWYAVLSANTPLQTIPMTRWGKDDFFEHPRELMFDFLAAEIMVRTIELAPRFLASSDRFTHKAAELADYGNGILEQLLGA